MSLKELKQRARSEGVVGFSRMKKAELEKALGVNLQKPKSFPAVRKVFPEKVAAVVDLSFDSLNSWFQGMKKKVNLNLKEKAREKLLKLNAKIKELLEKPEFEWEEKPGLGGSTFVVRGKEGYSAEGFLKNNFEKTVEILQKHFGFKVKMILVCRMSSADLAEGTTIENDAFFSSPVEEVFEGTDLERLTKKMNEWMLENMRNFQKGKSNWQFLRVEKLEIHLDEMVVGKYIPLPDWLESKKALTNMKNVDDEKCFIYCLGRWKNPVDKNPQRITPLLRKQCEEFNLEGISFPISWRGIDRFERQNDISVNVLGLDGKEIVTLRKTREKKENHVILFKLKQGENKHFALVNNINRLWFGQDSKNRNQRQVCEGCLNSFNSKKTLEVHEEFCVNDGVKAVLPPPRSVVKFRKVQCCTVVPFVIYADFESILEKTSKLVGEKTTQIQHHIPCSFCFLPVSRVGEEFSPTFFRGKKEDDVGKIFLEMLVEEVKWILTDIQEPLLKKNTKRIIWKEGEKEAFEKTDICWFCEEKIEEGKVADHCHLTGKFRGAAHELCNLQARVPKFTPVFMHNLDGYDSHLFIKNAGNEFGEISAIPNNEEKYVSFSLKIVWGEFEDKEGKKHKLFHEIRFLDSLKFMNYPLADLVKNLGKEDLHCLKRFFTPEDAELLSRKGIYPYEFMDSFEKFDLKSLPEKNEFFSQLNGEISDEDFSHAKKVWEKMGIQNLGEYHDLYLKTDVFLLADVVENFRTVLLKNYLLDPAWFLTAPSFFWCAMLKMTGVKLELICEGEVEMFRFFERQIRGGVSTVFHRLSWANNKFMKDFDPEKKSKFIVYLDANSLSEDINSLASWFQDNELIINLKKGKTEVMLFGTAKRLSGFDGKELNLSVNGSRIDTTTNYKYLGVYLDPTLNLDMHFYKTYKKAAGRVNLLRRIRSNTDTLSAERIYRAMIMPIFTYCGQITLGWSETRRCQIRNLEQRSHRIILQNSKCLNCELRLPSIENFLKKKACLFVFDCLKGNVCSPFKDYFNFLIHDFNTRNSKTTIALPKVKLDFARKSFYFLGASVFNFLPLKIKQISCKILFRESLDQFFV